jgi:hypothetical protein
MFENRVLRGRFGPGGVEWEEVGEECTFRSIIFIHFKEYTRFIKSRGVRRAGHMTLWER